MVQAATGIRMPNPRSWPPRSLTVIDDFLRDPASARRWALEQTYYQPQNITGWRSRASKVFPGTLPALKHHFGNSPSLLSPRLYGPNGTMYLSFSKGRRSETPGVHWDEPESSYIVLVYLTPGLPSDCGTSFWRHKATGLMRAPVRSDENILRRRRRDLAEELEQDSERRSRWDEIDRIGYRFNRAVVFPAYALHSATTHYGSTLNNGRLYQLLSFRTENGGNL